MKVVQHLSAHFLKYSIGYSITIVSIAAANFFYRSTAVFSSGETTWHKEEYSWKLKRTPLTR
ncbi:hypothetical protein PROFUN_07881 [Planoprotostelium fungivorum]|uniref:Uncharacterized protein n=1 Tax=Planoprotostelium fungivorum TaxID=1890364 RepID=A0A2P6NKY6_9EUKA|nr:hypothetical protein PROFUN_07881 [Planoprotostelium fungivorum]